MMDRGDRGDDKRNVCELFGCEERDIKFSAVTPSIISLAEVDRALQEVQVTGKGVEECSGSTTYIEIYRDRPKYKEHVGDCTIPTVKEGNTYSLHKQCSVTSENNPRKVDCMYAYNNQCGERRNAPEHLAASTPSVNPFLGVPAPSLHTMNREQGARFAYEIAPPDIDQRQREWLYKICKKSGAKDPSTRTQNDINPPQRAQELLNAYYLMKNHNNGAYLETNSCHYPNLGDSQSTRTVCGNNSLRYGVDSIQNTSEFRGIPMDQSNIEVNNECRMSDVANNIKSQIDIGSDTLTVANFMDVPLIEEVVSDVTVRSEFNTLGCSVSDRSVIAGVCNNIPAKADGNTLHERGIEMEVVNTRVPVECSVDTGTKHPRHLSVSSETNVQLCQASHNYVSGYPDFPLNDNQLKNGKYKPNDTFVKVNRGVSYVLKEAMPQTCQDMNYGNIEPTFLVENKPSWENLQCTSRKQRQKPNDHYSDSPHVTRYEVVYRDIDSKPDDCSSQRRSVLKSNVTAVSPSSTHERQHFERRAFSEVEEDERNQTISYKSFNKTPNCSVLDNQHNLQRKYQYDANSERSHYDLTRVDVVQGYGKEINKEYVDCTSRYYGKACRNTGSCGVLRNDNVGEPRVRNPFHSIQKSNQLRNKCTGNGNHNFVPVQAGMNLNVQQCTKNLPETLLCHERQDCTSANRGTHIAAHYMCKDNVRGRTDDKGINLGGVKIDTCPTTYNSASHGNRIPNVVDVNKGISRKNDELQFSRIPGNKAEDPLSVVVNPTDKPSGSNTKLRMNEEFKTDCDVIEEVSLEQSEKVNEVEERTVPHEKIHGLIDLQTYEGVGWSLENLIKMGIAGEHDSSTASDTELHDAYMPTIADLYRAKPPYFSPVSTDHLYFLHRVALKRIRDLDRDTPATLIKNKRPRKRLKKADTHRPSRKQKPSSQKSVRHDSPPHLTPEVTSTKVAEKKEESSNTNNVQTHPVKIPLEIPTLSERKEQKPIRPVILDPVMKNNPVNEKKQPMQSERERQPAPSNLTQVPWPTVFGPYFPGFPPPPRNNLWFMFPGPLWRNTYPVGQRPPPGLRPPWVYGPAKPFVFQRYPLRFPLIEGVGQEPRIPMYTPAAYTDRARFPQFHGIRANFLPRCPLLAPNSAVSNPVIDTKVTGRKRRNLEEVVEGIKKVNKRR